MTMDKTLLGFLGKILAWTARASSLEGESRDAIAKVAI
jgi:hypothetical protein